MAARIRGGEETAARAAFTEDAVRKPKAWFAQRPEDGGAACVLGMANAAPRARRTTRSSNGQPCSRS